MVTRLAILMRPALLSGYTIGSFLSSPSTAFVDVTVLLSGRSPQIASKRLSLRTSAFLGSMKRPLEYKSRPQFSILVEGVGVSGRGNRGVRGFGER